MSKSYLNLKNNFKQAVATAFYFIVLLAVRSREAMIEAILILVRPLHQNYAWQTITIEPHIYTQLRHTNPQSSMRNMLSN